MSALLVLAAAAHVQAPAHPSSLTCQSDGRTRALNLASLELPARTISVTGRVRRPQRQIGHYSLRVVLTDAVTPPTHAAGLMSKPMVAPLGEPRPEFGYYFKLFDSAGSTLNEGSGWLVVSDEFSMTFDLTQPGQLSTRLDWRVNERFSPPNGTDRSVTHTLPIARDDFRRLTVACWNGDFELHDIRIVTAGQSD